MFWFGRRQERATAPADPLPDDARRLHLRFVGQVQGVGFRWTSMGVARDLGLTGWVKNELDGSVTAEIQGARRTWARSSRRCSRRTGTIRSTHRGGA